MDSPEYRFAITSNTNQRTQHRQFTMALGAWTMAAGSRRFAGGSLGVLVDSALGTVNHDARPSGTWTVTSELRCDVISVPSLQARNLTLHGTLLGSDAAGAIAGGEVVDDQGKTVAVAVVHSRFVPVPTDAVAALPARSFEPRPHKGGILETIGATLSTTGSGDVSLIVAGDLALVNDLGALHGGIVACASEAAGSAALDHITASRSSVSLDVKYLRPVPVVDGATFTTEVLHRGRTMGVAKVVSYDKREKVCSMATVTVYGDNN